MCGWTASDGSCSCACLSVLCVRPSTNTPVSHLCLGVCVAESIRGRDLRYFVGPVDVPDTTYFAGYSMHQTNSTRICETYVSDECVAKKGAEVCVVKQVCGAALDNPGTLLNGVAVADCPT